MKIRERLFWAAAWLCWGSVFAGAAVLLADEAVPAAARLVFGGIFGAGLLAAGKAISDHTPRDPF